MGLEVNGVEVGRDEGLMVGATVGPGVGWAVGLGVGDAAVRSIPVEETGWPTFSFSTVELSEFA